MRPEGRPLDDHQDLQQRLEREAGCCRRGRAWRHDRGRQAGRRALVLRRHDRRGGRADAILPPLDAPKAKKPRKAKAEPKPRKEAKAKAEKAPKGESKQDRLIALLKRPEGASVTELVAEFGWAAHTVRGAVAGALKRKLGLDVDATKDAERGGTVYRIATPSKGE